MFVYLTLKKILNIFCKYIPLEQEKKILNNKSGDIIQNQVLKEGVRCVVAKVLNRDIVVSEFELQLHY